MNLDGFSTGPSSSEIVSRSRRERRDERPNERNGPPSCGSRFRQPGRHGKTKRHAHRREVDLKFAPHEGGPELASEETRAREEVLTAAAGGRWSTEAAVFASSSVHLNSTPHRARLSRATHANFSSVHVAQCSGAQIWTGSLDSSSCESQNSFHLPHVSPHLA